MSISAGDFVECVDASPSATGVIAPVVVGTVYRVEDVAPKGSEYRRRSPGVWVADSLWIKGVNADDGHWGGLPLKADRFRPIYTPKSDLIDRLMQPVLEDA